ncbi:hypothetical protein PF008_g20288 [Phytophthora fragariae]|uniref:Uncharacterized protein n=1 Tax=Phytophthora fragariae TaxID=53985 RepID=A0A6G0QZX5_9STRA|nr:hypothetical protein PF008_g20288 [Phytophthora fragariae]
MHSLRHLSASTRFPELPPPRDGTLVALADSQVRFFFQLALPDAEAADVDIHGFPSPLGRRTHAQPSRTIQRGARRSLELAGLRPRHLRLGCDTKSAGCSNCPFQLVDTRRAPTELFGVSHEEGVDPPEVVLQRGV